MTMAAPRLALTALPGIPRLRAGDDLAGLLLEGVATAGERLAEGDILVVAQKLFSKAEGRAVDLATVVPSASAEEIGREVDKDPRVVELILRESQSVLRRRPGLLIVVHRLGFVLANAGIDASNVEGGADRVLLLPVDPDASCRHLRDEIAARTGIHVAVVMNDSIGRAWRMGTVGTALGAAGLPALWDMRGQPDLMGRPLRVTQVAFADQIASAASLLQGEAAEGLPAVLIRGLALPPGESGADTLIRPPHEDLFR